MQVKEYLRNKLTSDVSGDEKGEKADDKNQGHNHDLDLDLATEGRISGLWTSCFSLGENFS